MAKQKRQSKLIMYLIIILGLVGGYIYYSQTGAGEFAAPSLPQGGKNDLSTFQNLKIDFSILNDQNYQALQIFGELPVTPGVGGKRDIFAPF